MSAPDSICPFPTCDLQASTVLTLRVHGEPRTMHLCAPHAVELRREATDHGVLGVRLEGERPLV
jgi:hypothetical protein